MKRIVRFFINKIFLNYNRPFLSRHFYDFAERYFYFYRGECNPDMETNGEMKLLNDLLKNGERKCVFDVGANVGEYVEMALKFNSDTNVHCFEPNPEAFVILCRKFANVVCNRLALSNTAGERDVYSLRGESSFSSFFVQNKKDLDVMTVETATLDQYCLQLNIKHVDLLKIDVEGSEMSVLLGSEEMIKNKAIDIIQFEYGHASLSPHILLSDFVEFFKNYDYILYKMTLRGLELINYTPWMEGCPYANFVATRRGFSFNKPGYN